MAGSIIAMVNNKGGVGKTTLTINLAHALANKEKNVLTVDTDSQCNSTDLLLDREFVGDSLYEAFEGGARGEYPPLENTIYPSLYKRLSCLANVEETTALEFDLSKNLPANYEILRTQLRTHAIQNYDYTLIDCPPNLGFFVINALYAADFVIVPILCGSQFSLEGLSNVIRLIREIRETGNPELRFLRLLINAVDKRTTMSRIIQDQCEKLVGNDQIFQTKIGTSAVFQSAEFARKTVLRFAPRSPGAKAYRNLAKEMTDILGDQNEPTA